MTSRLFQGLVYSLFYIYMVTTNDQCIFIVLYIYIVTINDQMTTGGGWGDGAELFPCPYLPKVQARLP